MKSNKTAVGWPVLLAQISSLDWNPQAWMCEWFVNPSITDKVQGHERYSLSEVSPVGILYGRGMVWRRNAALFSTQRYRNGMSSVGQDERELACTSDANNRFTLYPIDDHCTDSWTDEFLLCVGLTESEYIHMLGAEKKDTTLFHSFYEGVFRATLNVHTRHRVVVTDSCGRAVKTMEVRGYSEAMAVYQSTVEAFRGRRAAVMCVRDERHLESFNRLCDTKGANSEYTD